MFRKFKFEEEVYEKLQSIPLSTQYKLERVGILLPLKNWNRFSDEERHVLCHLSVRSQGEMDCYKKYLLFLQHRLREKVEWMNPQTALMERAQWENLTVVPEVVYLRALRLKVMISAGDWIQLDDLERYALFRLSMDNHNSDRFEKAFGEFLSHSIKKPLKSTGTA